MGKDDQAITQEIETIAEQGKGEDKEIHESLDEGSKEGNCEKEKN